MRQLDIEGLSIGGMDAEGDGLADGKFGGEQINPITGADLFIIGGVRES